MVVLGEMPLARIQPPQPPASSASLAFHGQSASTLFRFRQESLLVDGGLHIKLTLYANFCILALREAKC